MTALLAKATILALAKHPVVNSSCRDGKSFTYNSSINVAMDGGLIAPVLQEYLVWVRTVLFVHLNAVHLD